MLDEQCAQQLKTFVPPHPQHAMVDEAVIVSTQPGREGSRESSSERRVNGQ